MPFIPLLQGGGEGPPHLHPNSTLNLAPSEGYDAVLADLPYGYREFPFYHALEEHARASYQGLWGLPLRTTAICTYIYIHREILGV